jgi:hypothetical protein
VATVGSLVGLVGLRNCWVSRSDTWNGIGENVVRIRGRRGGSSFEGDLWSLMWAVRGREN